MTTCLTYVIKFVENMDKAVQFHVDQLDLKLRFQSPEWSEFDTGATTFGSSHCIGRKPSWNVSTWPRRVGHRAVLFESDEQGRSVHVPPTDLHGQRIAKLRDIDGAECSVSGP